VWLAPLLKNSGLDAAQTPFVALFAVALYVVGMAVDFIAYWLVRPLKPFVRGRARKRYESVYGQPAPAGSSAARQAKLALHAPELAKEVAMRSSRDRIARCAVVSAIIALVLDRALHPDDPTLSISIGIPLVVLLIVMWGVFEYISFGYELRAERELDAKLRAMK
jgi:hypothetical protein